jgi:hypothetical protein
MGLSWSAAKVSTNGRFKVAWMEAVLMAPTRSLDNGKYYSASDHVFMISSAYTEAVAT